jgi:hypothetical protein
VAHRGFARSRSFVHPPQYFGFLPGGCGTDVLVVYGVRPGFYNPNANLLVSLLAFSMVPLAWHPRWYGPVVHVSTSAHLTLITNIATQTGGVNATAVVWLNVVALPVLLLLGSRAALFWIGTVLATIAALYVGMGLGWVDSQNQSELGALPWTWMNHVMALANRPQRCDAQTF